MVPSNFLAKFCIFSFCKSCVFILDKKTDGHLDKQTEIASSSGLLILNKNLYIIYCTLCSLARLLLATTYICTMLVFPFFEHSQ